MLIDNALGCKANQPPEFPPPCEPQSLPTQLFQTSTGSEVRVARAS